MKFGEVMLTAAVSTVMTIGVLLIIDRVHERGNQESSDEDVINITEPVEEPKEVKPEPVVKRPVQPKPEPKKRSIFGGVKRKVGEAVLSKKLLDEIENRDITITIHLDKK